jgi:hypothetical protein
LADREGTARQTGLDRSDNGFLGSAPKIRRLNFNSNLGQTRRMSALRRYAPYFDGILRQMAGS